MSGSSTLTPKLIRNALNAYRKETAIALPLPCLTRQHDTNAILDQALAILKKADPATAALLTRRYLMGHSAQRMADHLDYSVDNYNKVQRRAVQQLAATVLELEQATYETLRLNVLATTAIPGDLNLLGTSETAHKIAAVLCDPAAPSLYAIQGVGGIGKTSLAFEVMLLPEIVSRFKPEFVVCDAGISAETVLPHIIDQLASRPHINCHENADQKREAVQYKLRTSPHLIVIDNLESLNVVNRLLKALPQFSNQSRFLLTTREFEPTAGVQTHLMQPLNAETSIQLMRRVAVEQTVDLTDGELTALHGRLGGNPYAIKLVVPLLKQLPLRIILNDLPKATLDKTQVLYDHIFERVWKTLSPEQQRFLEPFAFQGATGVDAEDLRGMNHLSSSAFWNCVPALVNRSLLYQIGSPQGQRFGIHRLLASFLLTKEVEAL